MDSISRVDDMVRQNNIKYMIQKEQKDYQQQLQQFKKQNQKQALKLYTDRIKDANKKAVQKKKQQKRQQNLMKKKLKHQKKLKRQQKITEDELDAQARRQEQNRRNKLNVQDIKKVQEAIETRASKLLQQKQLQKLQKKLAQQKKKTKLHQLNTRCRKLVKSHTNIMSSKCLNNIPQDRRLVLQQYEKKAIQQIQELDNIIDEIITGQKTAKPLQNRSKTHEKYSIKKFIQPQQLQHQNYSQQSNNAEQSSNQHQEYTQYLHNDNSQGHSKLQLQEQQLGNLQIGDPLFSKTTQQLLSLKYFKI